MGASARQLPLHVRSVLDQSQERLGPQRHVRREGCVDGFVGHLLVGETRGLHLIRGVYHILRSKIIGRQDFA